MKCKHLVCQIHRSIKTLPLTKPWDDDDDLFIYLFFTNLLLPFSCCLITHTFHRKSGKGKMPCWIYKKVKKPQ